MGMQLIDRSVTPPGGWAYTQPDSGFTLRGNSFEDLLKRVKNHRTSNNFYPGTNLMVEVEDSLCEKLLEKGYVHVVHVAETKPDPRPQGPEVHPSEIRRFAQVAFLWLSTTREEKYVSQEEANARASICAACPMNVSVSGCAACRRLGRLVTQLVGQRSTPHDGALQACKVCGCDNKAQVHLTAPILVQGITPQMEFPEPCWKRGLL